MHLNNIDEMYKYARKIQSNNNYNDALNIFLKINKTLGLNYDVLIHMAQCYKGLNKYKESIVSYRKAIDIESNGKFLASLELALLLVDLKKGKEAIQIISKLSKTHDSFYVEYNYALVLSLVGESNDSIRILSKIKNRHADSMLLYLNVKSKLDFKNAIIEIDNELSFNGYNKELIKLRSQFELKKGSDLLFKYLYQLYWDGYHVGCLLGYYLCIYNNVDKGTDIMISEFEEKRFDYIYESMFFCLSVGLIEKFNYIKSMLSEHAVKNIPKDIRLAEDLFINKKIDIEHYNLNTVESLCYSSVLDHGYIISSAVNELLYISDCNNKLKLFDEVITYLNGIHDSVSLNYIGQTIKNGTQTEGYLFYDSQIIIEELKSYLELQIAKYIELNYSNTYIKNNFPTRKFDFSSAFSVRIKNGGEQSDHFHSNGILSGVLYLDINESEMLKGNGWIRFGKIGRPFYQELAVETYSIRPTAGMLLIFPSYLWHGVNLYESNSNRLTVVFDVIPEQLY